MKKNIEKEITVEVFDLSKLDKDCFVLIHASVAKELSGAIVKKYIDKVKEGFALCRELENRGIQYSVIPNRKNTMNNTKEIRITTKKKNDLFSTQH